MRFFDFIFLKRKLALDQENMTSNLERSKRNDQPMWLVLFPEGTGKEKLNLLSLLFADLSDWIMYFVVVSECTRKRSKEFAEKNNMASIC
jgi:hypothetical protein